MTETLRHKIIFIVTTLVVTMFLGCSGKADEIRAMSIKSDGPTTEGRGINTKYIDSGRMTVDFKTPYFKDYANALHPYQEFPEGVEVVFMDEEGKENTVTSDYALLYKETNLIDLQRNVRVFTSDSAVVTTEQLYWDQVNRWIFTNKPYTIVTKDGSVNDGDGFDTNQELTDFVSLSTKVSVNNTSK